MFNFNSHASYIGIIHKQIVHHVILTFHISIIIKGFKVECVLCNFPSLIIKSYNNVHIGRKMLYIPSDTKWEKEIDSQSDREWQTYSERDRDGDRQYLRQTNRQKQTNR